MGNSGRFDCSRSRWRKLPFIIAALTCSMRSAPLGPPHLLAFDHPLSNQRIDGRFCQARCDPSTGSVPCAAIREQWEACRFRLQVHRGRARRRGIHPFCTPGKGLDLFWRRVMLPLLGAAVAASSSRAIIRRSALLDGQAVLPRRRRARLEGRHRSFYKFRSA